MDNAIFAFINLSIVFHVTFVVLLFAIRLKALDGLKPLE
jgi:hypothetical protein